MCSRIGSGSRLARYSVSFIGFLTFVEDYSTERTSYAQQRSDHVRNGCDNSRRIVAAVRPRVQWHHCGRAGGTPNRHEYAGHCDGGRDWLSCPVPARLYCPRAKPAGGASSKRCESGGALGAGQPPERVRGASSAGDTDCPDIVERGASPTTGGSGFTTRRARASRARATVSWHTDTGLDETGESARSRAAEGITQNTRLQNVSGWVTKRPGYQCERAGAWVWGAREGRMLWSPSVSFHSAGQP